jgi:hypothetical protein
MPGELKSDFPVIRQKSRISGVDRAPGQLFGGIFIAVERLGPRRVQENVTVPRRLGDGVIDLQVRAGPIAELSQGEPSGGTGGRPFLKRHPVQVEHRLASLAELGEDLTPRAQRHRVPAVQREDRREDSDGSLTFAKPPESDG